jgi:hypothetical protein
MVLPEGLLIVALVSAFSAGLLPGAENRVRRFEASQRGQMRRAWQSGGVTSGGHCHGGEV